VAEDPQLQKFVDKEGLEIAEENIGC